MSARFLKKSQSATARKHMAEELTGDNVPVPEKEEDEPQDPDRAYEQKDLVSDPRTGEPIPAEEVLDDAHLAIRSRELVEQDENPRPDPSPIPEKDIPKHAFELLMSLQEAVRLWDVNKETALENGEILREYKGTVEPMEGEMQGRETAFAVQLIYTDSESHVPSYGNLEVIKPETGWQREYYFQASTAHREGKGPHIYFDDYPYHQEDLRRPVKDDFFAVERGKELIAEIPRTK